MNTEPNHYQELQVARAANIRLRAELADALAQRDASRAVNAEFLGAQKRAESEGETVAETITQREWGMAEQAKNGALTVFATNTSQDLALAACGVNAKGSTIVAVSRRGNGGWLLYTPRTAVLDD